MYRRSVRLAGRRCVALLALLLVIAGCTMSKSSTIIPSVTGVGHPDPTTYCSTHECRPTTTTLPPVSACHHGTVTESFAADTLKAKSICLYVSTRYRLDLTLAAVDGTWDQVSSGRPAILRPLVGAQMNGRTSETTFEALHIGVTFLSERCSGIVPPCDQYSYDWFQEVEIIK
jgi:hypothetical protein